MPSLPALPASNRWDNGLTSLSILRIGRITVAPADLPPDIPREKKKTSPTPPISSLICLQIPNSLEQQISGRQSALALISRERGGGEIVQRWLQ